MAEVADNVARSIERFLAAVRLRKRVDRAYLYGSHTSGRATKWSDIDVAVISADFSSDLFAERLALMRLAAEIDERSAITLPLNGLTTAKTTERNALICLA